MENINTQSLSSSSVPLSCKGCPLEHTEKRYIVQAGKHPVDVLVILPNPNLYTSIYKEFQTTNDQAAAHVEYFYQSILKEFIEHQKEIYKDFQRNIRVGIKRGDEIVTKSYSSPSDVKKFRDAWKKSVNFDRYVPSLQTLLNLRKSYQQNKCLFLASHNISGRIIGGVIFTISSHGVSNYITYYNYGFISNEGRSSLSMAALLYQGILWGKKMGCKIFDFEGIYDDRFPQKSWLGFTRFKKSFGGQEVVYPGCYIKFRLPQRLSFLFPH